MLRHTRWSFSAALLILGGCVDCSELRSWQGEERASPTNTVLSLRFHLCEEDWTAASAAVDPASELARGRGEPAKEEFWKVSSPIASEGALLFPLGPEDAVGEAKASGNQVEVEVRHARRYEKDPRPRALILEEQQGTWRIVASKNW